MLFKHCKKVHHPTIGNSIRLGTLTDYRTIENQAIKDDGEGTFHLSIEFQGHVAFDLAWLSDITFGSPFIPGQKSLSHANVHAFQARFGNTSGWIAVTTDRLEGKLSSEDKIYLDGKIDVFFYQHDRLVFCMSRSNDVDDVILDDEYNCFWNIDDSLIPKLNEILFQNACAYFAAGGALENISSGPFPKLLREPPGLDRETARMHYMYEHGPVEYKGRKIVALSQTDISQEEMVRMFARSAFIKPLSYSRELEYRFTYYPLIVQADGTWFGVDHKIKPTFVPSDGLATLLETQDAK